MARPEQPVTSVRTFLAVLLASILTPACAPSPPQAETAVVLRVGIGGYSAQAPERGVRQFLNNLSQEGLLRLSPEGHTEPGLAEKVETSPDGLQLTIQLRPRIAFHDGSLATSTTVVEALKEDLPKLMGSASEDVVDVSAGSERQVVITLSRPNTFVADALVDVPIHKPGNANVGAGPFAAVSTSATSGPVEMQRHDGYYLKPAPEISRIIVNSYENTRAAWADMLRERLDMLYEVDIDAIDSMRASTTVSLYSFERPYQYMVMLNSGSPKLTSPAIRRALNQAIDRTAIVREGLGGQGSPSAGPISQHHWAYQPFGNTFTYAPQDAAAALAGAGGTQKRSPLRVTCLTLPGLPYERLALVVKKQLEAVGVNFDVQEVQLDRFDAAIRNRDFEAALLDPASGPSMFRIYRWWMQSVDIASPSVKSALEQARHAVGDEAYRTAVFAVQRAMAEDPPAVFLAWGTRSRAVSRKFDVRPEPGRDIIGTLRLWRPAADKPNASNN